MKTLEDWREECFVEIFNKTDGKPQKVEVLSPMCGRFKSLNGVFAYPGSGHTNWRNHYNTWLEKQFERKLRRLIDEE